MKKNEVRLLTYRIVPVLGLEGSLRLPSASVKFHASGKPYENKTLHNVVGVQEESLWREMLGLDKIEKIRSTLLKKRKK